MTGSPTPFNLARVCEFLDTVIAPSWSHQDLATTRVHMYAPDDVLAIRLRIEGQLRTAVVLAHLDQEEGRAVQLHFAPALRSGEHRRWVWWNPDRMRLHTRTGHSPAETEPAPEDAIQVPVPAAFGALAEEKAYQPGQWPRRWVRIGGAWYPAELIRTFSWSRGPQTAVLWVQLPAPGWSIARYARHYLLNDPHTIRQHAPIR